MKSIVKKFAIVILLFNGITACFGGWLLMYRPDGSALNMSVELLEHSPFSTFLIPGIILFFLIGLLSLWTAWLTNRNHDYFVPMIFLQGCLLLGWIAIQIIMIQTINYLHLTFGSASLLLIISALMLSRKGVVT